MIRFSLWRFLGWSHKEPVEPQKVLTREEVYRQGVNKFVEARTLDEKFAELKDTSQRMREIWDTSDLSIQKDGIGIAKKLARKSLSDDEIHAIAKELQQIELKHGILLSFEGPTDEAWDEEKFPYTWKRIQRFWDETGLFFIEQLLQDIVEIYVDGKYANPPTTLRGCGQLVADWHNSWFPNGQFIYTDFYAGCVFKDYVDYESNLRRVLEAKAAFDNSGGNQSSE